MTNRRPVSLRIPPDVRDVIRETAAHAGRDFSSVANEMLAEGVRMRRVPGIVFVDEPHGRAPWIAGTGLEAWDVVRSYRDMGADWGRLRAAFYWLSEAQLRSALTYAEAYPEYVAACERREQRTGPEQVWREYPSLRPSRG
jgi:uncharacterized protein (DUF433 family)